MKKWIIGILGAIVISVLPLFGGGEAWAQVGAQAHVLILESESMEGVVGGDRHKITVIASGQTSAITDTLTIKLSVDPVDKAAFYLDAETPEILPNRQVAIPTGQDRVEFFVEWRIPGTVMITATDAAGALGQVTRTFTITEAVSTPEATVPPTATTTPTIEPTATTTPTIEPMETPTPAAQVSDIKLIEGPSISFDALRGKIDKTSDGHLQITIVNSLLNDYSLVGEIQIKLPRTLLIHSTTDGASGGATSILIPITNPISPGSAESFDIFFQATSEASGNLSLNAIVRYWAIDPSSGLENKVEDRSVSRDQIITVVEPTDPTRLGTFSDGSGSTGDSADTTQPDTGSSGSSAEDVDSGFEIEWWVIVLGVLGAILAVAFFLGLFRIIFN